MGFELSVCAVASPEADLGSQTHQVEHLVSREPGSAALADALSAAVDTGASWIWLLEDGITPQPDALRQLVRALEDAASIQRPVLAASKVVRPDGRLDVDTPPWPRMLARELSLLGAEHRLMALRATRWGSLLVHRRAVELHGPPRPDYAEAGDDLEWTGRILRDETGFLVPQSVVTRSAPLQVDQAQYIRNRLRILRGDAWSGQERAWFAYVLISDVLRGVVRRPSRLPGTLRALGRGARAPV